jgi:hypothetical protein
MDLKKIIRQNEPKAIIERLKARWYLDKVIEKIIFIVGSLAIIYLIIKLILWFFIDVL